MGEKMDDSKIYLEFGSRKIVSCNVYKLKVPNVLTLPEYRDNDFEIDSPSFEFESATWCFRCRSAKYSDGSFGIDILRLNTEIPKHIIYFKLALLNARNGQCDESYSYYKTIEESCEPSNLYSFPNDEWYVDGCDTLTIIVYLFTFESTEVDAIKPSSKTESLPNMAEEIKDCKISLELTRKTASSDFYTMQLPNVFTAPKKDFDISSPTFNFANTTCCFHFQSDGNGYFTVGLEVFTNEAPLGNIFIISNLIGRNDEIIERYFEELDFTELPQKINVASFHSSESTSALHFYIIRGEELKVYEDPVPTLTSRDSSVVWMHTSVFQALSCYHIILKNKGVIEVPDIEAQAMKLLPIFNYTGKVDSLNDSNVLGVYYTADKYNFSFLKKECSKFMKKSLSPSTVCDVTQLALNQNDTGLLKCCTEYFVNHTGDILPTVEWMSFLKANPIAANELYIKAHKKWNCSKS